MSSITGILFGIFLGGYIARLLKYQPAFCDDYWLIENSLAEDPDAWFCWFVRAHKRWQQQSIREALNCWVMAKMISPTEYKILYNIAVVLKYLKQNEESLKYMKEAQKHVIKGQEKMAAHLLNEYKRERYQLIR